MNRKILGLTAALTLAAGCEFAEKTEVDVPGGACLSAVPGPAACTENAQCCSYACVGGACAAGDFLGAVCRTTNDCADYLNPTTSTYEDMICKSGRCADPVPFCRDLGDVCLSDAQCGCGNRCTSSSCTLNRPPLVDLGPSPVTGVPVKKSFTLVNGTTDPDGDSMSYSWTLSSSPGGSTLVLSPAAKIARNLVFTPDVPGDYVFTFTVTDLPLPGLSSSGSVTINAVNLPPVVTPALATVIWERNVGTLTIGMNVYDENSDLIDCTWSICRPGTATCFEPPPAAPPQFTAPNAAPGVAKSIPFPTGNLEGIDEGRWDVTLACSDPYVLVDTLGTTEVTVINTPPTVTVPATRTFNLGADAASTPLANIVASATDDNVVDPIDSWNWTLVVKPAGSLLTTANIGASTATSTVTFKPDVPGLYQFDVTACDPPAYVPVYVDPERQGCTTARVDATVYEYIRLLAPVWSSAAPVDAAFAKASGRLVLAGPDASAGGLWDYDLTGGTAPIKTSLTGVPNAVTLTPNGATAVAGDGANVYQVLLGNPATLTTHSPSPLSIGDLISVNGTDVFLFGEETTLPQRYYSLNLSNATFTAGPRYGNFGAAVTGSNDTWFFADTYNNQLFRYRLQGQNPTQESAMTSYTAGALWSSANGAHVFASDGAIYPVLATPLPTLTPLTGANLGISGIRSVDTATDESVVLAVSALGEVRRYNSAFNLVATDPLPHWGDFGTDRGVEALFAFVSNDATTAYVVLKTTSTPIEYGLYTYTIP